MYVVPGCQAEHLHRGPGEGSLQRGRGQVPEHRDQPPGQERQGHHPLHQGRGRQVKLIYSKESFKYLQWILAH